MVRPIIADALTLKYGRKVLMRSALNLENGEEDLMKFLTKKPINVAVEIGTFRGVSSIVISRFCKKLYTLDLKYGQFQDYKRKFDWADTPARQELWDDLEINNISLIELDDNNHKKQIINQISNPDYFDFAFIDGDHSYEGVKYDFELVKHCGRVLFHDYDKAEGKDCPVRDFIGTIKTGKFEYTKDFAYWEA